MAFNFGARIFLSSLCVAVFTFGSFLNIVLVFILIRSRENRTKVSSVYLLSLSTSQIFACLYEAPYYFLSLSLKLPPPPQDQYRLACRISIFITYFISAVKIFNLTVMSVDRYVAIIFPFTYERHATKRTATLSIAFVWILPFVITLPLLIVNNWTNYDGRCGYACGLQYHRTAVVYTVIAGLLVIPGPLIIMMITNIRVFSTARQQKLKICNERAKMEDKTGGETIRYNESEYMQYSELGKDIADDSSPSLEGGNQSSLGSFHPKLGRESNSMVSSKQIAKPAKSLNHGSTNHGATDTAETTCDEVRPNTDAIEAASRTETLSTELHNEKGDGIDSCATRGLENNVDSHQVASRILNDRESAYFCNHSNTGNAACTDCTSSIDMASGEEAEEQRHSISQGIRGNAIVASTETTNVYSTQPEQSEKPLDSLPASLSVSTSASTNNGIVIDGSLEPRDSRGKPRLPFLKVFERRLGRKLTASLGGELGFSWNIVLSTLLLVLAFFITYIPFLVTRFIITGNDSELSDELVTYTALLTTLGNIINPGIVLGTRRKLRNDFIKLVCCKQRSSAD